MNQLPLLRRCCLLSIVLGLALPLATVTAAPSSQTSLGSPAERIPALFAAEEDSSAEEAEEDDATVLGWIVKSGWSGYIFFGVLGLFSIFAMTVAFERLVNLTREKMLPAGFVKQFRTIVERRGGADEFLELCDRFAVPVAAILKAGLLRSGRPLPEVEKAMEDAAAREVSSIRSKTRPLTVIGSVAPLVGLLGTVVGMILAFHTTSQEGTGKAELLAEGIYLALLTTAAGLTIAIPCMLLAAYFNAKLERYMREIDEQLMEAMPAFAEMERQYDVQLLPPKEQAESPEPEFATAPE